MASPPFQVEDQTDEDFFDKLVDDDLGFTGDGPGFMEGKDFDEVKAFSNLSIREAGVGAVLEKLSGEGEFAAKEELHSGDVAPSFDALEKDALVSEESIVSSNSLTFDNAIESSGDAVSGAADVALDSTTSKSSGGSMGTSVKEVQWSVFNTDSTEHRSGSYSDFFTELGDNSVDQCQNVGDDPKVDSNAISGIEEVTVANLTSFGSLQHQEGQAYSAALEHATEGQDLHSSQYWENLYPGWRYDPNTGEWHQLDGDDASANTQGTFEGTGQWAGGGVVSEVSYLKQTAQPVVETIAEDCTTACVSNWNQVSQGSTEYPAHMVFDPQYPGWYYDTIAQEWHLLESYTPAVQSTSLIHDQQNQNENALAGGIIPKSDNSLYSDHGKAESYVSQGLGGQDQGGDWTGSTTNYTQQQNRYQSETIAKSEGGARFTENQQSGYLFGSTDPVNNYTNQQIDFTPMGTVSSYEQTSHCYDGSHGGDNLSQQLNQPKMEQNQQMRHNYDGSHGMTGFQSFLPADNLSQHQNRPKMEQSHQMHHSFYDGSHDVTGFQSFLPADNLSEHHNQPKMEQSHQMRHSYDGSHGVTGFQSFFPADNRSQQLNQPKMEQSQQMHFSHDYYGNQNSGDFSQQPFQTGAQSFLPSDNLSQQLNQPKMEQSQQMHFSHDYYGNQNSGDFSQPPFQTGARFSYVPNGGRSSAGRPPHALVSFGFGGKLIVMKDTSSFTTNSAYGSQDSAGSSISMLNLMEVVMDRSEAARIGVGTCDYFRTLCQHSFPGPLIGGSVGSKELNKWIDERIADSESPNMDYRKGELLRLLLSLLKISCQHYGKLRSPFGTDSASKENDRPESAVAQLFASAKKNGAQLSGYGALTHCLHDLPSEIQIQATAIEVQNLLVSGRIKEALHSAQEGQLWGPALVLAAQLGDQFYVDTVKQMAHRQLVAGSPLRTLCLLIAGQPADVFSAARTNSIFTGSVNAPQQPAQIGANDTLDDWEENLAIIAANRTKGDELVIIHLGDCLWKVKGEITAAHICYLVAEKNFESLSDGARMCLIGADHWKFPRTYASPEAIQRTEIYEYSMVLGNSQSILLPFQPYKLIYAHMLAEVGKISDSLKYCQAILKSLRTGRAPEVDTWKQLVSSLEERIRTYQQGGYSTNLAPAKLVGKLLPFIDRSIHRMIGAPPPSQSSIQSNGHDHHHVGPRVGNSQSTMDMSSLVPSASMEPISEWKGDGNRKTMPNRSISEPNFVRSPRQIHQSKEAASSNAQGKASLSGGSSRLGLFGSQILQKTMGWVSRSRPDRQAKLGEKNKFYYDEKLKRWVEEGIEPPAEEAALPPPPTTAFQNGTLDHNIKHAVKRESLPENGGSEIKSPTSSERSSGIPPIPPSSNQFSARGRMGVRSRYVDTFNKDGGTTANLFQSPSFQPAKSGGGANANFFIPTPSLSGRRTVDATESSQETAATNEDPAASVTDSFSSPSLSSSVYMQQYSSMNTINPIANKGVGTMGNSNDSLYSQSRRTASWGGSIPDTFIPPQATEIKSLGEALGISPPSSITADHSSMLTMNGGGFGDELHEVEL